MPCGSVRASKDQALEGKNTIVLNNLKGKGENAIS